MTKKITVEPGDRRWHDKTYRKEKSFTCRNCGSEGKTLEADAECDSCGKKTQLPIEVKVKENEKS